MQETPDVIIFLGRFHPLVVHFPIGFISLAIVLDLISPRIGLKEYKPIGRVIWLASAISASVAIGLGLLLATSGDYNQETLTVHKWSGIFLALSTFACYAIQTFKFKILKRYNKGLSTALMIIVATLLIFTGHFGGSLTHGSEYLFEYAPLPIQRLTGVSSDEFEKRKKISSLDSADVFVDAVMPILRSKCVTCHNKDKSKGDLLLTSYDDIMKGGEDGTVITAGSLASSELYRRITLPETHKEFMPSDGKKPLSSEQVAILEWWIENGALAEGIISSLKPDKKMVGVFEKFYGFGIASELELSGPPADTAVVNALTRKGFSFRPLAVNTNLLQATFEGDNVDVKPLLELKDQLVSLQLNKSGIDDDNMEIIGKLSNLKKLNVSQTDISDKGVQYLSELSKLEYLNLYGTKVTDRSVSLLIKLPRLKELYLWQTNVNPEVMAKVKLQKPSLKIVF